MSPPKKFNKIPKKPSYIKESTRDLSNLRPLVNPDLKKRSDQLINSLVSNLNRNSIKLLTNN